MIRNRYTTIALVAVLLLVLPTLVLSSVHAINYYTLQLGVSGHGTLSWVGTYQGATYTSGTTISHIVITVPEGTSLTFSATPQSDQTFSYWILDQSSQASTNPYVVVSMGAGSPVYHTVIANFGNSVVPPNPPLQVSASNTFNIGVSGSGKVYWSSSVNGVSTGSGWVDSNSQVATPKGAMITFTAVPLNGHYFSDWMINGVNQGSNNPFIMYGTGESAYANVIANFDQTFYPNPPLVSPSQFDTVNIGVQGSGRIYWTTTYSGTGYSTGSTDTDTSLTVPQGSTVTFTATPFSGNHFNNWLVNSANLGSTNPYVIDSVTVNSPATVIASFSGDFPPNPPLLISPSIQYDTIQVNTQGSGRLFWSSSYGALYDSGSTAGSSSIVVPHGATVTFTAVPDSGNHFNKWLVDSANQGSNNPYVVHNMYATPPSSVSAVFGQT